MRACPECETGRCPCGSGCPACLLTGQCSECHGTATADTAPLVRRAQMSTLPKCLTCDRPTPFREAPTVEQMRDLHRTPSALGRALKAQRCCGCHSEFPQPGNRPNTYRLSEATA